MIKVIGKFVHNIAFGYLDTFCEFVGLPVTDDSSAVTLRWVLEGSGGDIPLSKSALGYRFSTTPLLSYAGSFAQAYIKIDNSWRSKSFYISISPMPKLTLTPNLFPDKIDAILDAPEPTIPVEEPAPLEPTLEERNRADIDYLAMMLEVEL